MKSLLKTFVLALSLSAVSLVASANDGKEKASPTAYKSAMFVSTSTPTLNVMVEKEMGSRVQIRLKDSKGSVLHTDYLSKKQGKYWGKFDLSSLTDGTYRVEVSNGSETTVKEITLSTQSPETVSRNIVMN